MVPLLLMIYYRWRLGGGWPPRISETSVVHTKDYRDKDIINDKYENLGIYRHSFTLEEMKMLKWLLEELSEYWDDPYNDWTPGVQKYLGDIVYNKLGER